MALNTSRVTSLATPGVAAAATARPASGGRNVASVTGAPLEGAGFSPHIGINDNRLVRYDEDLHFDFDEGAEPEQQGTPFIIRASNGFKVEAADETSENSGGAFLDMLTRGVGTYENTMRVTRPGAVRPGSVMNYLF